MQTNFSVAQLADPDIAEANEILRSCVHCGFCTATCPTYVTLGDELDSPRGRIYLIKEMLENDKAATKPIVTHLDRCLSCLSCMTTCPSGVHYQHLIDIGRAWVEKTYKRPMPEKILRFVLAWLLPHPKRFRVAMLGAGILRLLAKNLKGYLATLAALTPDKTEPPSPTETASTYLPNGEIKGRVGLLAGCVQQVLRPEINMATIRLLNRHGIAVVVSKGVGCCGALEQHLGKEEAARRHALRNVDAWMREIEEHGLDAIIINASGCGTQVKDYAHLLRDDPVQSKNASAIVALAQDVSEFLEAISLAHLGHLTGIDVAYHSACSLQHGQKVTDAPRNLLKKSGFQIHDIAEGHLCCGSAGTYNLLQPEMAAGLRDRKIVNIEATDARVVVTGNIGCITQLQTGTTLPVVHTVQLLDWATGGPKPDTLLEF
ncbi:glycolate oxidase subunit GlcF [Alphaproteobacteria bacterium]|nr:glycolate oxidase subunit GlcF [Alphaproteobacteria bacterium]